MEAGLLKNQHILHDRLYEQDFTYMHAQLYKPQNLIENVFITW